MIKFFQFVKWCGRKIWRNLSSFIFWTPKALYRFFNYVKESLRDDTTIALCFWCLISLGIIVISVSSAFVYQTSTEAVLSFGYIVKTEIYISVILLAIMGVCVIYDIFDEEQQEIIRRLKK